MIIFNICLCLAVAGAIVLLRAATKTIHDLQNEIRTEKFRHELTQKEVGAYKQQTADIARHRDTIRDELMKAEGAIQELHTQLLDMQK